MTEKEIQFVRRCVERGRMHDFYSWSKWERKRAEVLRMDHGECQRCKAKKIYTKATTVHHINHVKDRPDLALEIWATGKDGERKRNLLSLCRECHEEIHGRVGKPEEKQITAERWD